jgi:hypothetical protein
VNGAESVRFDVSVISCVAESVRNDVSLTESTRYDVSLTESVGCDRVRQELRELEQVRLLRCANVTESVSPSVLLRCANVRYDGKVTSPSYDART